MFTTLLRAIGRCKPGLGAVLACVIAVGVGGVPGAPAGISAPDPMTCVGYPEPRVFLESQSWWSDGNAPLGGHSEHVHTGACFPYKQTISGIVQIDVVSHLHHMPGARLEFVRVYASTDQYGSKQLASVTPRSVCTSHDCSIVTTFNVDTNTLTLDGLTEFRIHSEAEGPASDPWRNLATTGWIADVENGKLDAATPQAVNDPETEGRGWYREPDRTTVRGYENSRFMDQLPIDPVSGIWKPHVRMLVGSEGEPIVRSFATIDPKFHAEPEIIGTVVLDQPGAFNSLLSIDTTKLADGRHKLVLRADAREPTGSLAGAMVIPFTVNNGGTPPPPPPPDLPPTAALTSPSAGQTVTGMVTLDVTASPDTMRVVYLVDGIQIAQDDTTGEFASDWNSSSVANGSHRAVARAFDAVGNTTDSAAVSFIVENAPASATVTLKNPVAGATVRGRIRMDVTTAISLRRVEYLVDGVRVAYDKTGPDFSDDWTSSTVSNGSHIVVARALDTANIWHASPPVQITVSN